MALIKCPECGRENVSDSAEICPDCGYGIKEHFAQMKKEEEQKTEEEIKIAEIESERIEAEKRKEERINSVPPLEKPQLTAPKVVLCISILFFFMAISLLKASEWDVKYSVSHGDGNPHFHGVILLIVGILIVCYDIHLFSKRINIYKLSKMNLREYQMRVIEKRDAEMAALQAAAEERARKEAMNPECPYCHSHKTNKITTTAKVVNTAMFGVLGQKRKYQWHCNNCKSDF